MDLSVVTSQVECSSAVKKTLFFYFLFLVFYFRIPDFINTLTVHSKIILSNHGNVFTPLKTTFEDSTTSLDMLIVMLQETLLATIRYIIQWIENNIIVSTITIIFITAWTALQCLYQSRQGWHCWLYQYSKGELEEEKLLSSKDNTTTVIVTHPTWSIYSRRNMM